MAAVEEEEEPKKRKARKKIYLPAKQGIESELVLPLSQRPCPNLFTPILVDNLEARNQLIAALESCSEAAVDTETTGLRVDRDHIIGICVSMPPWEVGYYVPMHNDPSGTYYWADEADFFFYRDLFKNFMESGIPLKFHNALFDVPMLCMDLGISVKNVYGDTMLKSHVIDADSEHGLKELSVKKLHPDADWYEAELHRYNKAVGGSKENPKYWLIPVKKVAEYGCGDVVFTGRLSNKLDKSLIPSLRNVYEGISMPTIRNLMEMRVNGLNLDEGYLKRGQEWSVASMEYITDQIRNKINRPDFNPASHDQIRDVFFNQLKLSPGRKSKKGFSTDKDELKRLKGQHPVVDLMIEYRGVEKLKSTYFDGLLEDIGPDGLFRPDIKAHGTRTGRLSMARLHQIPHGPLVRQAFIAPEGYVFVGGDHSQLEARVLAHYSQDQELLRIYREDRDIHSETAKFMFNLPCEPNEVDKLFPEERRNGKIINFALLYLETVFGLMHQLECSYKEAEDTYKKYFMKFNGIMPWAAKEVELAREKGFVEMISGRRRYLPQLKELAPHRPPKYPFDRPACYALPRKKGGVGLSVHFDLSVELNEWTREKANLIRPLLIPAKKSLCANCKFLWECYYTLDYRRLQKEIEHHERQALNTKIQGSAADLVNLGIVRTGEMLKRSNYDAILSIYVHDEVVYCVPKDSNVSLFAKDFGNAMESVNQYLTVPLKFKPKVGKSWAQLK